VGITLVLARWNILEQVEAVEQEHRGVTVYNIIKLQLVVKATAIWGGLMQDIA
jgi:hypothetical protein